MPLPAKNHVTKDAVMREAFSSFFAACASESAHFDVAALPHAASRSQAARCDECRRFDGTQAANRCDASAWYDLLDDIIYFAVSPHAELSSAFPHETLHAVCRVARFIERAYITVILLPRHAAERAVYLRKRDEMKLPLATFDIDRGCRDDADYAARRDWNRSTFATAGFRKMVSRFASALASTFKARSII